MAIKRSKPKEDVGELGPVEGLMGQGVPRIGAIRQTSVTEQPLSLEEEIRRNGRRVTEASTERE